MTRFTFPICCSGLLAGTMLLIIGLSKVPDLHAEEEQKASVAAHIPLKTLWKRWHFTLAIAAQFSYVAAQTGIFSSFINYISSEMPALAPGLATRLPGYMAALKDGQYHITDRGAATLLSLGGFGLFLLGRLTGSMALRVFKPHRMLALYSALNEIMMLCVVIQMGWVSVGALFLSFFLMSISYPTIFALVIHGLGEQTKKASSFLVMAILGGACMPMFMGWLADHGHARRFLNALGALCPDYRLWRGVVKAGTTRQQVKQPC